MVSLSGIECLLCAVTTRAWKSVVGCQKDHCLDAIPAATYYAAFQLTTSQWIRLGELSQLAKKEPCQSAADW